MRRALGTAALCSNEVVAHLRSDGLGVQDIGGDGFFFATIRSYRHKEWVDAMFVPYTVLFALAAIVSLASFLVNGRILLLRCRQHGVAFAPGPLGSAKRNSVGGVDVPANAAISSACSKTCRWVRLRFHCANTKRLEAGSVGSIQSAPWQAQ